MKKIITLLPLLALLALIGLGQPAPQSITLTAPPPPALNQLNLTVVGGLGNATYYYYIIVHYPIGAVPSNSFIIVNAPATLTNTNYVQLNWNPIAGASTYDIVRSKTTSNIFTKGSSGSCTACVVVQGLTTTSYNDSIVPTLPYTLNAPVAASVQFSLDNISHSTPYLTLNSVAGPTATFNIQIPVVCVSGCSGGGGTPGGSNNDIQVNSSGSFAGGRCTMDSSQNIVCTGQYTGTAFIGSDTLHSAILYLQGKTSGGVALGVDDIAGTAITYVLPSTNGTAGQVLSDNGAISCPTFAGTTPGTCHQLVWVNAPITIAGGTAVLGTGSISSATCATVVTVSATGVATTDVISVGFNSDPTGMTGYVPLTSGMLTIIPYPTANNVNFKVCNNTTSSITPGVITLNFKVWR